MFPTADGTYVGVTPDGNKKAIAMLQSTSKISLSARLVGFDRDRAFYPTVLICIMCIMCIICNDAWRRSCRLLSSVQIRSAIRRRRNGRPRNLRLLPQQGSSQITVYLSGGQPFVWRLTYAPRVRCQPRALAHKVGSITLGRTLK